MSLPGTIFGRLRKLLHVRFGVDMAAITPASDLGHPPVRLTDATIKDEFRIWLNRWFRDLIPPFVAVPWDRATTVGQLVEAILARANVATAKAYRVQVMTLADASFGRAAGTGAQVVPLPLRQQVRDVMNADLDAVLIGRISLDDLGGDLPNILANVMARMEI